MDPLKRPTGQKLAERERGREKTIKSDRSGRASCGRCLGNALLIVAVGHLAACNRTCVTSSLDCRRIFFFYVETVTADRAPPLPHPKGLTDRTKPPHRIFVRRPLWEAETRRSDGADRARRTLDLAVVIGHGLFDWNKVITRYLFRHRPPPPSPPLSSPVPSNLLQALKLTLPTWRPSRSQDHFFKGLSLGLRGISSRPCLSLGLGGPVNSQYDNDR